MTFVVRWSIACLLLITAHGMAQAADLIEEFTIGNWAGAAYEEQGELAYCVVGRPAGGGDLVLVLRAPSIGYGLGVLDATAPFREGASYSVRAKVDGRWDYRGEGIGGSDNLMRIPLPEAESADALEHIAAGNRLTISRTGGRSIAVSLSGSRRALEALDACYEGYAPKGRAAPLDEPPVAFDTRRAAPSLRVRQLASAVGLSVPRGTIGALRHEAETFDAGAMITLGLALIDVPDSMLFEDEAASWISLVADAGDVRAIYVLGRMIEMGLTPSAYPGHAEELIDEAADLGLADALVDRAKRRRDSDLPGALADLEEAADRGNLEARTLRSLWSARQPPAPAAPRAVSPPVATPTILAEPAIVTEGSPITIRYAGLPEAQTNWLAIAAPEHGPEQYFDFVMLEAGQTDGTHSFALLPPGEYVLRLYLDWPDGGYTVSQVALATVAAPSPMPAAPVAPQPAPPAAALPAAPAPNPMSEYASLGRQACFGEVTYPDRWISVAQECTGQGCSFGRMDRAACLQTAGQYGAGMIMVGRAEGMWPNECWAFDTCADLRPHDDFEVLERVAQPPEAIPSDMPEPTVQAAPAPPSNPASPAQPTDPDLVLAIQSLLLTQGYDPGALDARLSDSTAQAIRSFQTATGLTPDGQPSVALRDALLAAMTSDTAGAAQAAPPADVAMQAPAPQLAATESSTAQPSAPAAYIGPLCKDGDGNYTVDIVDYRMNSCVLDPPQTIHISPTDDRMVTCTHVAIHDKQNNRTLAECRSAFDANSTFIVPLRDGQAECFEAKFHPNGALKTCDLEYGRPLLRVETMGQSFLCANMEFDEQENLTLCRSDQNTPNRVSLPTGYGDEIQCELTGYGVIEIAKGLAASCRALADYQTEDADYLIACEAGTNTKFENGLLTSGALRDCTRQLKNAIGPATETLVRANPQPGPTDLSKMPACGMTSSETCHLKGKRWIAMGPDGAEQVLCQGSLKMYGNPGFVKTCSIQHPAVLNTAYGPIQCHEFSLGPDGLVEVCEGVHFAEGTREQLPDYVVMRGADELVCALDLSIADVAFWPGQILRLCTPQVPAVLAVGAQGHTTTCMPDKEITFWPNGGVRRCHTEVPVTVPGPEGGEVTCQPGDLRFLPNGGVATCVFADGGQIPLTLPDGQRVTCLREIEHLHYTNDDGTLARAELRTCDAFAEPVILQAGGESYSCIGGAWHRERDGGGLAGCVTTEVARFTVNHEFQPQCGRADAVAILFEKGSGAISTIHQCRE